MWLGCRGVWGCRGDVEGGVGHCWSLRHRGGLWCRRGLCVEGHKGGCRGGVGHCWGFGRRDGLVTYK